MENKRLQIYFATAVRGGINFAKAKEQIEFLETIGDVLTKHMASPETVDMNMKNDVDIYERDAKLVMKSDIFIADFSEPSTGGGFMAGWALELKRPLLCLYRKSSKPSAMIVGCPAIDTRFYDDGIEGFKAAVLEYFDEKPRIFLAGLPGSGKGTLAKRLAAEHHLVHVSTGDLVRKVVSNNTHRHAKTIREHMEAGQLVPADIMKDLVLERLAVSDCRLNGYILDGYPPSKEDLANLRGADIEPTVVFYLDCGDGVAISRQVGRNERSTDTSEKAEERVQEFHSHNMSYQALSDDWFPESMVVRIDAEQSPDQVFGQAKDVLTQLLNDKTPRHSFFPVPPYRAEDVRSDRVHLHIDAKNIESLRKILKQVYANYKPAQGQIKIYPIDHLHLGPQVGTLEVYKQMPNFHEITGAEEEAFVTGRLGNGDMQMMKAVLKAALDEGGMAEMEEYLGEWTLSPDGTIRTDFEDDPLQLNMNELAGFKPSLCKNIPSLELHLGFNLPKSDHKDSVPPVHLFALMEECRLHGLKNGGWFIFANEDHWAYRSNEFTDHYYAAAKNRLINQMEALQKILKEKFGFNPEITSGLEIVHGIWTSKNK